VLFAPREGINLS